MGMWIIFTKNPTKPITTMPMPVDVAIFLNSTGEQHETTSDKRMVGLDARKACAPRRGNPLANNGCSSRVSLVNCVEPLANAVRPWSHRAQIIHSEPPHTFEDGAPQHGTTASEHSPS